MDARRIQRYAASAALVSASAAHAAIVAWTNCNLVIPNTIDGLYINVETRTFGSAGSVVAGWDINPYSATSLTWFNATGTGMMRYPGVTTGSAGSLDPCTVVGASASYGSGAVAVGTNPGQWRLNSVNYFGFRFVAADGSTKFGVGTFVIGSSIAGADRTITNIYYEDSGASFVLCPPPPPQDSDGDGVPNGSDPCPTIPGPCNGCPLNTCGTCGTAPDTDNDGRPNCQDNCPTVPNPTQADCDSDGLGDACDGPDCNGNGRSDNCDIAAGSSTDVDGNGVPDECQPDCNLNGIPDRFDISSGRSSDLNSDGTPDDCQGGVMVDGQTENLGAPASTEARVHTFTALPKAESPVSLTIDARGDLDNSVEWIDVSLNGSAPYRLFQGNGSLCPVTPDRAVITLSRADFNALIGPSSTLTAVLSCPVTVDGTECRSNGLTQLRLRYTGINPATGDCNGNDRLDVIETFDGTTPDCNLNRVPDSCDIARGGVADCNQNGVPDPCELAGNPSLDCNGNGLLDSCEIAGGSPDIDGNGKPDDCQTVTVPGQFQSIQAAILAAPVGELRIISVAAGTYPGPVDFLGKPVIVRGASAATTAISGAGGGTSSVVRFAGGGSTLSALERVTIRGGSTGSPIGDTQVFFVGGGVLSDGSAANLRDCVIESNFASFGGGGYWRNSTGRIERCTFRSNSSGADGGGLQVLGGAVTVVDTVVESNVANGRGGGMHAVGGRPTLTRVVVRSNQSSNLVGGISWVPGGEGTAFLTMQQCEVTGNSAAVTQGGIGIVADGATSKASLAGSTVCGNLPRPNVAGPWTNLGGNTVCVCIADLNGDDAVNGNDLGILLAAWGPCTSGECAPDLNGDSAVDGSDLGVLLSRWGPCAP